MSNSPLVSGCPGPSNGLLPAHDTAGNVVVSWVCADSTSDLFRNAIGDELVYVQSGDATLETSFRTTEVVPGD